MPETNDSAPHQPTREQCWAAAYALAAQALARIARDRAAGRLAPDVAAHLDQIALVLPAAPRTSAAARRAVVVPREEALRRARAVLDAARAEDAADYAAGRMSPDRRAIYERLLARRAQREAAEAKQTDHNEGGADE